MTTRKPIDYKPYKLRVPVTVWGQLLSAAERDQMTIAEFIREAIKDRIKRRAKDHKAIEAEYK